MEYFEGKRSGQIPAFGNWDSANELPITQYFENARQAGLVRCNVSALTTDNQHQYCNPYMTSARASGGGGYPIDLCAADSQKPSVRLVAVPPRRDKTINRNSSVYGSLLIIQKGHVLLVPATYWWGCVVLSFMST
nr:uncharacterized protein LOC113710559 isoform X3 [Coffea arabica]